jgi:hypothetical protein
MAALLEKEHLLDLMADSPTAIPVIQQSSGPGNPAIEGDRPFVLSFVAFVLSAITLWGFVFVLSILRSGSRVEAALTASLVVGGAWSVFCLVVILVNAGIDAGRRAALKDDDLPPRTTLPRRASGPADVRREVEPVLGRRTAATFVIGFALLSLLAGFSCILDQEIPMYLALGICAILIVLGLLVGLVHALTAIHSWLRMRKMESLSGGARSPVHSPGNRTRTGQNVQRGTDIGER